MPVLFAFQLSLPLNSRFAQLGDGQRGLYIASLLAAVVATTLLLGPVAYHQGLLFGRGMPWFRPSARVAVTGQ